MLNWDLQIFFPILIFLGLLTLAFVCWKEKLKKQAFWAVIENACLWLFIGFMFYTVLKMNDNLNAIKVFQTKKTLSLIFMFLIGLLFIFINPIAQFVTTIFKSRKNWTLCSYGLIILWFILEIILPNSWYLIFILLFLLILILPTATVQILTINEQYFYKINTVALVWTMVSFGSFGFFAGYYLVQIDTIYIVNQTWIMSAILLTIMTIIFVFGFFKKENRQYIGGFDQEIIEQLPKAKKLTIIAIYSLAFLVSLAYILTNLIYVRLLIFTNLSQTGISENQIKILFRIDRVWFLVPIIFFAYVINKYLLRLLGQKNLVFIGLIALFCLYGVMAFISNGIALIILSTLASFIFFIILFSLFSFAFFWNYRIQNQPIVGWFWTSVFIGVFLTKIIENTLITFDVGVLESLSFINGVVISHLELSNLENQLSNIVTLVFACCALIILAAIVIFTFAAKQILADFKNYKFALQNLRTIIKNRIKEKTKTQIDLKEKQN